jgi:hypothetical protein
MFYLDKTRLKMAILPKFSLVMVCKNCSKTQLHRYNVPGTPKARRRLSPRLCPLATMLRKANPTRKENPSHEKTLDLNHHPHVVPVIHHRFGQKLNSVCIQTFHKKLPHPKI